MRKITRRQFFMCTAGTLIAVVLPVTTPVQSAPLWPNKWQWLTKDAAEELAMRLWQHPTLSYCYSDDGRNWKQQVYHNITLPFSDDIVTLDSQLTTTKIFAAFKAARKKVAYLDHMTVGIDWPKGLFHVPK